MRALLDVNVLIALLDVQHMHHDNARSWLRENIQHGWATCPFTQERMSQDHGSARLSQ